MDDNPMPEVRRAIEELERQAALAEKHAKFCSDEADAGGSSDLHERATGVYYIAGRIRRRIKELSDGC